MTPAEALARRAVAAGLVPVGVISSYNRDSRGVLWLRGRDMAHLPDLEDAATLGCLLAIVREAWGEPEASTTAGAGYDGFWGWWAFAGGKQFEGTTEAEALVAALEAAPVRR